MSYSNHAFPPLSQAKQRMLRARLDDLRGTARKKGTTLDDWDEQKERAAGREHYDLGCWLYFYAERVSLPDGLAHRIDCARRIFTAGITNPGYRFFTAFDFGERQFDCLFEMGDAEQVIEGLRAHLPSDRTGNLSAAFNAYGWPLVSPASSVSAADQGDLFLSLAT